MCTKLTQRHLQNAVFLYLWFHFSNDYVLWVKFSHLAKWSKNVSESEMQPEMFTFWIRYFFIFSYFPKYWITAYIKRCCCCCQRNWQENPSTKGNVSGQRHKHTTNPPSHNREVAFKTTTSLSIVEEIRGEHEDPLWWSWIWCLRLRLRRATGCTTLTQGHLLPRIWWIAEMSRGDVQWKVLRTTRGGPMKGIQN